jgi:hypothetical protein
MQGADHMIYGAPSGGLSPSHKSIEDCAIAELSEEVHLRGGQLVRLLPPNHPGLMETKWCRNRGTPFLVIDAEVRKGLDPVSETKKVEIKFLVNTNQSRMLSSGFVAGMCGPSSLFRQKKEKKGGCQTAATSKLVNGW